MSETEWDRWSGWRDAHASRTRWFNDTESIPTWSKKRDVSLEIYYWVGVPNPIVQADHVDITMIKSLKIWSFTKDTLKLMQVPMDINN